MLPRLAKALDDWVIEQNLAARAEGMLAIRPCTIRVLGQTALFEAHVPLTLAATRDVDVRADYEDSKNRPLLTEYLAQGASDRFLKLASKYAVDLEQFL